MKRTANLILLPALLISLFFIYGCPVDMDYPPDEPGSKPIDETLLGNWKCVSDTCDDLQNITVERNDDNSYYIYVSASGENYMADDIEFTGYITQIDGKNFIYAEGQTSYTYFTYNYILSGNTLTLFDVGLLEGGKDSVTSIGSFRSEISASLKKPGCLTSRRDFQKE